MDIKLVKLFVISGFLLLEASLCSSQQCLSVASVDTTCLDSVTSLNVTCPEGYIVNIEKASIVKDKFTGCSISYDTCLIKDITTNLAALCDFRFLYNLTNGTTVRGPEASHTCEADLIDLRSEANGSSQSCTNYSGDEYSVVYYTCDGRYSPNLDNTNWLISMCEDDRLLSNSQISINSVPEFFNNSTSGRLEWQYISSYEDCHCAFLLPGNTSLEIKVPMLFTTFGAQDCSQRVDIIERSDSKTYSLCQSNQTPIRIDCSPEDRIFDVIYVTNNMSVSSIFTVELEVNYRSSLRVICGTNESHARNPLEISMTWPSTSAVFTRPVTPSTTTTTTSSATTSVTSGISSSSSGQSSISGSASRRPNTPPTTTTTSNSRVSSLSNDQSSTSASTRPTTPPTTTTTSTNTIRSQPFSSGESPSTSLSTQSASGEPTTLWTEISTPIYLEYTTQVEDEDFLSTAAMIGLIAGCLSALVIIVVLSVAVMYCACKNRKNSAMQLSRGQTVVHAVPLHHGPTFDDVTAPRRPIYVTDMYLEGESPSQFVIERPQYHSPYMKY